MAFFCFVFCLGLLIAMGEGFVGCSKQRVKESPSFEDRVTQDLVPALSCFHRDDYKRSVALCLQLLARYKEDEEIRDSHDVGIVFDLLATSLAELGRYEPADSMYVWAEKLLADSEHLKEYYALTLRRHGLLLMVAGKYGESEKTLLRCIEATKDLYGPESLEIARVYELLAMVKFAYQDSAAAAIAYAKKVVPIVMQRFGLDNGLVQEEIEYLSTFYVVSGSPQKAVDMLENMRNTALGGDTTEWKVICFLDDNLGFASLQAGDTAGSLQYHKEAVEIARANLAYGEPELIKYLRGYADALSANGKVADAAKVAREELDIAESRRGESLSVDTMIGVLSQYGRLLEKLGKGEQARAILQRADSLSAVRDAEPPVEDSLRLLYDGAI